MKKRILIDFIYSIFAYSLPTLALQLIIQPLLAAFYDVEAYGLYVTLFSVIHLGINCLITPLTSLRLLKKIDILNKRIFDNTFNFLFLIIFFVNAVFVLSLSSFYFGAFKPIDLVLILLLTFFISFHDYYSVQFRLEINYKKIILDNLILVSGFFVGFLLCRFVVKEYWQSIFITGYVFSSVFILFITRLWANEPKKKGLSLIRGKYLNLSFSSSLNNSLTYCDKLIIYPVLGAYAVAVYSAATVVSKLISFVAAPVRNVLLSYAVDRNQIVFKKSNATKKIILIALISVLFLVVTYFLSAGLCYFLYNKYFQSVLSILIVTVLSVFVETISNILNVMLLKVGKAKLQSLISIIKIVVYVIFVKATIFTVSNPLLGFCISSLVANCVQLVSIVYLLQGKVRFE